MGAQGWFVAVAGGEGGHGSAAPLKTDGTSPAGDGHFRAGGGLGEPGAASAPLGLQGSVRTRQVGLARHPRSPVQTEALL